MGVTRTGVPNIGICCPGFSRLGVPEVGDSRSWGFQKLGVPDLGVSKLEGPRARTNSRASTEGNETIGSDAVLHRPVGGFVLLGAVLLLQVSGFCGWYHDTTTSA